MAIDSINNSANPQFATNKTRSQRETQDLAPASNPLAKLDKDAFMKLLLTELQHQDPTEPMDSSKMLEQTSQLATLEMQDNTNQVMKELTAQMQSNLSMSAMGALGKMASLSNSISKDGTNSTVDFSLHFHEAAKSGEVEIYDNSMNLVRTIPFGEIPAGINKFTWDGKGNDGLPVIPGEYLVKAKYQNESGNTGEVLLGSYPVEAVRFVNGKAEVKLAGVYIPIENVREFSEPVKSESPNVPSTPDETPDEGEQTT